MRLTEWFDRRLNRSHQARVRRLLEAAAGRAPHHQAVSLRDYRQRLDRYDEANEARRLPIPEGLRPAAMILGSAVPAMGTVWLFERYAPESSGGFAVFLAGVLALVAAALVASAFVGRAGRRRRARRLGLTCPACNELLVSGLTDDPDLDSVAALIEDTGVCVHCEEIVVAAPRQTDLA